MQADNMTYNRPLDGFQKQLTIFIDRGRTRSIAP